MSSHTGADRNRVKYQVFQYLLSKAATPYGLTIYDIAQWCPDATLEYLKTRLHIWHRAGLLTRRKVRDGNKPRKLYHYHLSDKGCAYYGTVPSAQRAKAKAALQRRQNEWLAKLRAEWAAKGI